MVDVFPWVAQTIVLPILGPDTLASLSHSIHDLMHHGLLFSQVTDADLVGEFQAAFKKFVETGQIWAMLIGMIVGYFFRALTTYG